MLRRYICCAAIDSITAGHFTFSPAAGKLNIRLRPQATAFDECECECAFEIPISLEQAQRISAIKTSDCMRSFEIVAVSWFLAVVVRSLVEAPLRRARVCSRARFSSKFRVDHVHTADGISTPLGHVVVASDWSQRWTN